MPAIFAIAKFKSRSNKEHLHLRKATITLFSLFWIYTQYVVVKEYISERIINIYIFIYKAVILPGRFRVVLTSYSVKRLVLVRAGSWNRSEVVGD